VGIPNFRREESARERKKSAEFGCARAEPNKTKHGKKERKLCVGILLSYRYAKLLKATPTISV
jgi:hypothetical protein